LLQNIISNPKADLNILMTYGADTSERLSESKKLLEDAESKKDKAASELLKNVDLSNLKIDGGEVASSE
jgi:ABC-type dipeptide/oligopeptide/nickel transport system ATPase component